MPIDPGAVQWDATPVAAAPAIDPAAVQWDEPRRHKGGLERVAMGLLRGGRDIVDTGALGIAKALDALTGNDKSITGLVTGQPMGFAAQVRAGNKQGQDEYAQDYGDSWLSSIARLTGNVGATWPVGGLLAAPLRGVAPRLATSVASAGMRTGAPAATTLAGRAADLGIRGAGGAITGGVSAGLIDPGQAETGAAIGGALPAALQMAGAGGRALALGWQAMRNPSAAAAQDLSAALNLLTPAERAAAVTKLRAAQALVPGGPNPTVAQALMTPEASITERVVHDTPGGKALRNTIQQQADSRLAALEGVAPTNPLGVASAREDLGQTVSKQMNAARTAERARVSGMYENVDPDGLVRLQLPIDELTAARDKYLGAGTFGQGSGAASALKTARDVGLTETPTVVTKAQPLKPGAASGDDMTLGAAVRQLGIHPNELQGGAGYGGEVRHMKESKFGKNLVNKNGKSLDRLAEQMYERGYLDEPDVGRLIEGLSSEASGFPVFSKNASPEVLFGRARDAGMPDRFITPGKAEPVALDWRTLQNFRGSLGDAGASAEAKGATQDAAALHAMKAALGNRVDQAGAQGLLKPGEEFPLDAYARWTDANAAHAASKGRFDTGPLAGMFRKGPNGEPALQGGEIAARAWGARPGLADDVRAFRRLVDDNPALMNQFRGMVTTEGAGTTDAAGKLTTKFSKWVDQTLPGLRETFDPQQVETLQRIAQDIDRAAAAQKLGTSLGGSNTYQNAANALNLGLLDNAGLTKAAAMVPGLRWATVPGLEALRTSGRNAKATRLADLLSDSQRAATGMEQLQALAGRVQAPSPMRDLVLESLLRGAPVAAGSGR